VLSGSTRWVMRTFGWRRYSSMWAPPRPWMPATATRTASLAPRTRPEDLVPATATRGNAAAAAAASWRNPRRVSWVMRTSGCGERHRRRVGHRRITQVGAGDKNGTRTAYADLRTRMQRIRQSESEKPGLIDPLSSHYLSV